jgi:hypothetical protein
VFLPNYLIVQEGKRKRELRPAGFLFTPGIMEWVFSSGISVSNLKTKSKIRMDPRVKPEDDEEKKRKEKYVIPDAIRNPCFSTGKYLWILAPA